MRSTHYLSDRTSHRLDEAWVRLRRMTGRKVSRSEIVDAAIQQALRDFERREGGSQLAERMRG